MFYALQYDVLLSVDFGLIIELNAMGGCLEFGLVYYYGLLINLSFGAMTKAASRKTHFLLILFKNSFQIRYFTVNSLHEIVIRNLLIVIFLLCH